MKAALLVVAISVSLVAAEPPTPVVGDVVKSFKTLKLLTPNPRSFQTPIYPCARPATPEQLAAIKELEKGPHTATTVNHYRNLMAGDGNAGPFLEGSILIKEKLAIATPGKDAVAPVYKTKALAGMIKRAAGSMPKSGDWEFFWFEDGKVTKTGMESCAGCHSGAKKDYVFTDFTKK